MNQLNEDKVKKDLERWGLLLREIDERVRTIYLEMDEIYKEVIR
jgi:hypothetical protein